MICVNMLTHVAQKQEADSFLDGLCDRWLLVGLHISMCTQEYLVVCL